MILRKLIEKLILLINDYQKENTGPDLGYAINALVHPIVNAAKSITIDLAIKAEKIQASELIKIFLEGILKEPKIEIGILSKLKVRFEAEKTKAKEIRKNNPPGTYDSVLEICSYAIERALFYYYFCNLKNAKEEDVATDPKLIVEDFMLDFLINSEIWKEILKLQKKQYVPKTMNTRMAEIFGEFGVKDESSVNEFIKQVQEFLYKLDQDCKSIDKNSLQYIIIVDTNILSALYEQSEKCRAKGIASDLLKNLLLYASASIQKLDSYKMAKKSLRTQMNIKDEQANEDVRLLLSQKFLEQRKVETKLENEKEQTQQSPEAAKRKEQEAKKKAEEDARKKQAEEARKKAEEDAAKARIEEARRRASDERKQEEERRKKEEAERAKKQEASAKSQPQPQPQSQPQPQPVAVSAPVVVSPTAATQSGSSHRARALGRTGSGARS